MSNEKIVRVSDDEIVLRCCGYKDEMKKEKCKTVLVYPRKKAMERTEKREPFLLECPKCQTVNCITEPIKEAREFIFKDKRKVVVEDWLGCVAFTGPTKSDPTGYITDGSNQLYLDIYGHPWTRDEFIEKYKCDPAGLIKILWEQHRLEEMRDDDARIG